MLKILEAIDTWLWGLLFIIILLGTHIFCTFRTGFVQRFTFKGIKLCAEIGRESCRERV